MKILPSIFFYFLILFPYPLLFYKKVSVQIRLLFVSLFELFILFMGVIIVYGLKIDLLIGDMYFYQTLVWVSILINIFIILVIWITKYKT
jgi:hypothetical protein